MLEKIIASKSKIKILREMIKNVDREFCLEDLVKLTGLSFGTVHPALKDLVDSRIILVKKIGRSKVYNINRRHMFFGKLKELFSREQGAFSNIAEEFVTRTDKRNVKNIILFGSVARGEFSEKSDVDMLFVCKDVKSVTNEIEDLSQEFLDKYDIEISPTMLSVKEVKIRMKKLDRFILKVLDEGKVLYGDARWLKK